MARRRGRPRKSNEGRAMNSPQSEARDCVAEGSPANLSLGMQKLTPKTPYEVKNSSPDLHEIGEASVRTGNPGKGELKSNLDQVQKPISYAEVV
ncbi:hypothetical protein DM860_017465 [Cuscuta australis]|uniref:Uncharacterized protein n=1 Tax=Cuscuta australis TaxID=267555 RepID=A0A328DW57_9ASTE|nr:hypothetical protein DM860_017465 [Cuscuta australis]